MIRIFAAIVLLLLAAIIWQRGSVSIANRSADNAAAAQERAEAERAAISAELAEANHVITTERANAAKVGLLAAQYEKDKAHVKAVSDRLVADLRSSNQRLHDRWQAAVATSELSAAAAAASIADGGASDRIESAGRIIGAAAACEAQVKGLQSYARLCSNGGAP